VTAAIDPNVPDNSEFVPKVFIQPKFVLDDVRDQLKVGFDIDAIQREIDAGAKTYIDSETCGLHSMMVLWQFAIDEGPIYLYHIWKEPVWKTMRLFEMLMGLDYVGFNLSFDHFHVAKIYTIWERLPKDWIPEEHILDIAINHEAQAQMGSCIKPKRACDLMLWSRKGKFQSAMQRGSIRIRRVPTILSYALARELGQRVELPEICFAKAQDPKGNQWKVLDREDKEGLIDEHFKDVSLRFNPAGGLKYLTEYALGWKPKYHFTDVELPRTMSPPDKKLGYIPTALGMAPGGAEDDWRMYDKHGKEIGHAWPYWIQKHIDHWVDSEKAQEYAYEDITYTRAMSHYFEDPEPGDDDSELACMVGIVRWHGFETNDDGLRELCVLAQAELDASPINCNKVWEVRRFITDAMDVEEAVMIEQTTDKKALEQVTKFHFDENEDGEECTKCEGEGVYLREGTKNYPEEEITCVRCSGNGVIDASKSPIFDPTGGIRVGNHPAAFRARQLLDVKAAVKEVELYNKLLAAGKFHPDFNVIGTLSTRMSGGSGLNAQGIKHDKSVRRMFPLMWEGMMLSGGDFDSFEVAIAAAVYKDPDLVNALTKKVECDGCKHGKTCEKCGGTGQVGEFECVHCQKDENGTTGIRNCKLCGGSGIFRKKLHALFGTALYPHASYEDVVDSDGTSTDMYTAGKSGVFALLYGGNWVTLVKNLGIQEEHAQEAEERFLKMFPGILEARKLIEDQFQSMKQVDGRQIVWSDPKEYVESLLGFRRSFELENKVCKCLFDLAHNLPPKWKGNQCKVKVVRSLAKGVQTAGGAVASSLFGAAFGVQGSNVRAAANHQIQSLGATLCKLLQRSLWDLQPSGVGKLIMAPINVHDEVLCVIDPILVDTAAAVVVRIVEGNRKTVPLLGLTWTLDMANWAEKKGGATTLKIAPPEMR